MIFNMAARRDKVILHKRQMSFFAVCTFLLLSYLEIYFYITAYDAKLETCSKEAIVSGKQQFISLLC